MPNYVDSVDKIIKTYFAAVTRQPFTYKKQIFYPRSVAVSPNIFRDYTCPPLCGGCCPRFSLDYLPSEPRPYDLPARAIRFNSRGVVIYSDLQSDHSNHHCRNLDMSTGRCGIHGRHPFSCDFELLRVHLSDGSARLGMQLFGRGWNLLRIDGERGALCEIVTGNETTKQEVLRKLRRLLQWTDYFGIVTCLKPIIEWVESGPHREPLRFPWPAVSQP